MIPKSVPSGFDPMVETGFRTKIIAQNKEAGCDPIQLNWIAAWAVFFYRLINRATLPSACAGKPPASRQVCHKFP
jgi:hypothetical protein